MGRNHLADEPLYATETYNPEDSIGRIIAGRATPSEEKAPAEMTK